MTLREQIEEIVNRETRAWDSQDVDLLLSVFHPHMVWPWPPTAGSHDPEDWVMAMGRLDRRRWGDSWRELFATFRLVHNRRQIRRIEISPEGDGAFCRRRHRYIVAREEWHNIALEGTRLQSVCESRR